MTVRELRASDLRCQTCDARPGALCRDACGVVVPFHLSRINEQAELVVEGWHWQEVEPRDAGPSGRGWPTEHEADCPALAGKSCRCPMGNL